MRSDERAGGQGRFAGALAVGAAALATVLVWQRYHSGSPDPELLAPGDLANYYYPLAETVGRRLAAGELPLWNPFSCSGIPLLATLQPAVLYPFSWLAAAMPTADALFFGLFAQVVLAGVFTSLALRAGGMHWAAAALGGAFYVHACLLGNLAWPPSVATMTWLPLLWLCVEKLARAMHFGWWVALALAVGLQLLAGFPQYTVYGYYWLAPYALVLLVTETPRSARLGRGAMLVLAVALGVGLAAAQLLPTAELAGSSARGGGVSAEDVHYLGSGTRPASQIVRNFFDPQPKNPTFDLGSGTGYLGIASVLAVVAMVMLRARSLRTAYLVVAGVLALLLSDGYHGSVSWLFAFLQELPTGGLFRTPERLRYITMICLVVLASGGLDALLRYRASAASAAWPGTRATLLALALLATAALVAFAGGPGAGWRAAVAAGLACLCVLAPSRVWVRSVAACAWLGFVTFDLWLATAQAGVLHDYPRQVSEQYGAAFRPARIDAAKLAELRTLAGYSRVEPRGFLPFHAAGEAHGLYRSACYEPLAPGQWRELSALLMPESKLRAGLANPSPDERPVFYDVASVSTIVRARRGVFVQPNPDALPRAYLVEAAVRRTQEEAFLAIRDGSHDFHTSVLLEEDVSESPADPAPVEPARIVSYAPERVEIEVEADRGAWLVLTDTFYPGWTARIDGVEAPILRANGLYRAVRVAEGTHAVVFDYGPASLRAGVAISVGSAFAIFAVSLLGRRRKDRAEIAQRSQLAPRG